MNLATNFIAVRGETVSDATIILAAVDPCYCCTERMAVVKDGSDRTLLNSVDLLRLSREKTEMIADELGVEMESTFRSERFKV